MAERKGSVRDTPCWRRSTPTTEHWPTATRRVSGVRYLLGGYHGMRNAGDDLLLYVTIREMMQLDPNAQLEVLSAGAAVMIPQGARVTVTPGGRRFTTVRHLQNHDVWFFGGGGLLQDQSPRHSLQRLAFTMGIAKLMKRQLALVGIGIGPLVTSAGRRAASHILRLADFITVRDAESADLATALVPSRRVDVTADLAFLFHPHESWISSPTPTREGRPTLGVSLLPHAASLGRDPGSDVDMVRAIARALESVMRRHPDWNIRLFQFFAGADDYSDAVVLARLQEHLAPLGRISYRPYDGDLHSLSGDLSRCDAFLGMRFHSCLLAYLAGVPCLMISYHPKSDSLARRLALTDEAIVSLSLLTDSDALAGRIDSLLSDRCKFRPGMSLHELKAAAARNFTLLRQWLCDSRGIPS